MKLEIIDRETKNRITTYSVKGISMLSFQEWKDLTEIVIPLDRLSTEVTGLDSSDPETGEPTLAYISADFYLPDPLKERVVERLAKRQMPGNATSRPSSELLGEVEEQACTPPLNVSTIILAVVEEIVRNHLPNSVYDVKISDD